MNIDELKYFIEAAREQNLSRAARTLGITQSTLSHAVRRLEDELGCALFEKKGKNVELTQHGKSLAHRATDLVADFRRLKNEMSSGSAPLLGHFRLGAAQGEPIRLLTRAWNRLGANGAVLELVGMRSAKILEEVSSRKLEYGLCFSPQPYPHVRSFVVGQSQCLATVRAGHPLLSVPRKKRLEGLPRYPLATARHLPGTDPCSGHPVFQKLPKPIAVRYFFDNYDVAREILLGSDAWALLPKAGPPEWKKKLAIVDEKTVEDVNLTFVEHETGEQPALTESLRRALIAEARKSGWKSP